MKRINFLMFILLISFVNQVLYAELLQELDVFSITLSNLANKIKPVGSGRPLPPPPEKKPTKPVVPPPLIPEKKPDEPSEPLPKFDKNKVYSFALGQDPSGSSVPIKIGLVDLGLVAADKGFDLVVHGPKFTKPTKPENFIVKKTQTVVTHGMPIETKVDKLSFPVDNAERIVWSSDNKIIKPGPLGNFVLVKGTDYQMLKEEEKAVQENMTIITSIQGVTKSLNSPIVSTTVDVFNDVWLPRFKEVTKLCQEVQNKKVESILKRDMDKMINLAQERTASIIKTIDSKKNPAYNKVKTDILAEQQKIKSCSDRIKTYSTQLSLENVLYKFYEAFIKGEIDSPVKLSTWWVIRERKATKPVTPEKPTTPTESFSWGDIADELQEYFENYKNKTSDKDREVFMATKTNYKNPKTGAFFTIQELLAEFIEKAGWEQRSPGLERWNQFVKGGNYGKFWAS